MGACILTLVLELTLVPHELQTSSAQRSVDPFLTPVLFGSELIAKLLERVFTLTRI